MIARRHPTSRTRRCGAAIVEMAVITPVLFSMILGIIEFGRMFMVAEVVINSSREGSRYAVAAGSGTVADVKTYTRGYLQTAGIGNGSANDPTIPVLTVSTISSTGTVTELSDATNLSTVSSGTAVQVEVQVDFSRVTWIPNGLFIKSGQRVKGTTAMRRE